MFGGSLNNAVDAIKYEIDQLAYIDNEYISNRNKKC